MGSLKKRDDSAGIFCWISTIVIQDSNCQIITVVFLDGKEDSREGFKNTLFKVCINGAAKSSSDVIKYNSAVSNCIYSSVTDFSLATQSVSWRGAKWPQWRCSYKGKAICCRNNNCGVYCHIYQYEFLSVMCPRLENPNEIYIFVPVPGWEYLLDERSRWISARYHANESFLATWSFLLASE